MQKYTEAKISEFEANNTSSLDKKWKDWEREASARGRYNSGAFFIRLADICDEYLNSYLDTILDAEKKALLNENVLPQDEYFETLFGEINRLMHGKHLLLRSMLVDRYAENDTQKNKLILRAMDERWPIWIAKIMSRKDVFKEDIKMALQQSDYGLDKVAAPVSLIKLDVKDFFDKLGIHAEIRKVSEKHFMVTHYDEAVFAAFKRIDNVVKEKAGQKGGKLTGKPLMEFVFSVNSPILEFNGRETQSEKDKHEGFGYIFKGAAMAVRNPGGHEDEVGYGEVEAMQYLCFASLLMNKLDKVVLVSDVKS